LMDNDVGFTKKIKKSLVEDEEKRKAK
jgi:hypothetical protein